MQASIIFIASLESARNSQLQLHLLLVEADNLDRPCIDQLMTLAVAAIED